MHGISWLQHRCGNRPSHALPRAPGGLRARSRDCPGYKEIGHKLAYTPGTPTVIAGYCGSITGSPQAKASVPPGVLIKGHYNGKIDSRAFPARR